MRRKITAEERNILQAVSDARESKLRPVPAGRRRLSGRRARTVGVSLFPAHVEWLSEVKRRTNLGPSAYLQALAHADMQSRGLVFAKALAIENEGI